MSIAALLDASDPFFAFEHTMAHRTPLGVMSPLSRFSAVPYLLDPMLGLSASDDWSLRHQQAHNDAIVTVPRSYGAPPGELGLLIGQNLIDTEYGDPLVLAWWTFENHQEHFIVLGTILPEATALPSPLQAPDWIYPFN